ncbi:zinc finger CCCH domain-containing protein 10 [Xiphophorus couchianus]|uniref:Zinc finger CCCH domain-containing protein 10 n=1 Tax=Xiphophorus couchianus TaxID=32473 RepID=A0A3B5MN55_9TELE|nr:zinc finger CCCH domain-containing protein 10 [Xiphophorus couchianus]XP_027857995.1 zinc finger CCCH domain-containing protein 10 [Xiphophorus couchianus]XP_027857996.1 zinc finger CCCH domain-containing protein 10 [Xiphophorus couchianus]XP_027857997.1 zinc finger CCCH domain-containing protein 10 [Xiphophorus couchianus]XP_027857998.1 zinc finger CCCH domain-containing protein 10 [Xiphophorus couchianus]XP_027857999.1 zinc finger CCCH domain-containing protein 10 [Xiphophorus couchianus]
MPDRDSSYLSGGGGSGGTLGEEGGPGSGLVGGSADCRGGSGGGVGGNISGSGGMGGGTAPGNSNGFGNGGGGGPGAGLALDGVCRDFIRNVCKRGKRCRFKHPDFNEVPDLGVQKNEFIFCHDYQNKDCMRSNCRFVHGSKEDEDYYKKTGELPPRLRGKVAARLGLSLMDLPLSRGEVPICRDFLKGECQRGNKCKFRHVKKDYEYEPSRAGVGGVVGQGTIGMVNTGGGMGGGGGGVCGGMQGLVGGGGNMMGTGCPSLGSCRDAGLSGVGGMGGGGMSGCLSISSSGQRRYDRSSVYDPLIESGLFDAGSLEASIDYTGLQLKRRRLEGLRLTDSSGGHYELGVQAALPPRPLEYRFLEEENSLLRKRVEELKKQVSNLIATNEVLLEQNAQFRSQAKVMTLSSTPAPTEQNLAPPVGAVSSYNHSIAQTHTTLSSAGLQSRPVTQQDLVAPTGAPAAPPTNAAPPTAPPPHLNPEITPLSAALAQTIAQGMAPPVSMAQVAVSVAPVAVSMTQPLPGITMSHATTPMVSYPIASQSMRITTLPH